MIKELSFDDDDDDDGFYPVSDLNGEEDAIVHSKIPSSHLAQIIDEFETDKDDFEDNEFTTVRKDFSDRDDNEDDITLDSLGLR